MKIISLIAAVAATVSTFGSAMASKFGNSSRSSINKGHNSIQKNNVHNHRNQDRGAVGLRNRVFGIHWVKKLA